jgi:hypothetical protein
MLSIKPAVYQSIFLFIFLTSQASAALIEYTGSGVVTNVRGNTDLYVSLSLVFDDNLQIHDYPVAPIEDRIADEHPAYFSIPSYRIDIDKMGSYSGNNGRLNMWYDQDPYTRNIYPEQMQIFAGHGYVSFHNNDGTGFDWSSWLGDNPTFDLAPVILLHQRDVFYSALGQDDFRIENADLKLAAVPAPGAIWLFSFGLLSLPKR